MAHFKRLAALADDTFKAELDETFSTLNAPTVKLGDVCEVVSVRGHQIKQNEIKPVGRYPVVSQSERKIEGFSDEPIVITDVPLILFGDHTCCVKFIDFPFIVGADGTKLLRPHKMELNYFRYCLEDARKSLCDGKYRRHFSDLIEMEFPLPSLDIQREIVGKLEAVKARCKRLKAEAERGLKAAEALRKAVLAEAFEQ
ncbi:MAG: restriction endonuclease subunit S [Kiritimatiellae bacterium]|nr:restriction endonuclease subunit S [Kiritimatiellia bacterium]